MPATTTPFPKTYRLGLPAGDGGLGRRRADLADPLTRIDAIMARLHAISRGPDLPGGGGPGSDHPAPRTANAGPDAHVATAPLVELGPTATPSAPIKGVLPLPAGSPHRRNLSYQLTKAREIQSRLAPSSLEELVGLDVAVCSAPAMWVGGDYCNIWALPDGRFAFAVADVSGHGLPAGLVMSNLHGALRATVSFCQDLAAVAQRVHEHLSADLPEEMFVTLLLGLLDPTSGQLEWINAGHLPPLVGTPGGHVEVLGEPTNLPIGLGDRPFQAGRTRLEPGWALTVVTDGVTEATSPSGEQFTTARVVDLLDGATFASARQLVDRLLAALTDFRQRTPLVDDLTIFALVQKRRPHAEQVGQWYSDVVHEASTSEGKRPVRLD